MLKDVSELRFIPGNNAGSSSQRLWETDWRTLRRYVKPHEHIRVWEGGEINLMHSLDKLPEVRDLFSGRYGMHIMLRDELPPMMHDGKAVPKAWLTNTVNYFVDTDLGRVYPVPGLWQTKRKAHCLRWVTRITPPNGEVLINALEPDHKAARDWWSSNAETVRMAQVAFELEDRATPSAAHLAVVRIAQAIETGAPFTNGRLHDLGYLLEWDSKAAKHAVILATGQAITPEYLKLK